ncbi:hypothetical protein C5167_021509 [Papaver somniferum]|uniref:DEAD-box ATP-dependent RNA helicase 7-like n=1 Tax=Papaver somniferum TaxID=3469 RepID=UPI000E6FC15C|nr:DEAD-box ATP-dependent RNA helicase 7-like [Papaver somniferum]RZC93558.1 hypothetical protein C5167_021509 [Papaver somniferum]
MDDFAMGEVLSVSNDILPVFRPFAMATMKRSDYCVLYLISKTIMYINSNNITVTTIPPTRFKFVEQRVIEIHEFEESLCRREAQKLIETSKVSPLDLFTKALALALGCPEIISLQERNNFVTLHLVLPDHQKSFSNTWNVAKLLRQYFPKLQMELSITANRRGAVFDVPLDDLYGYTENAPRVFTEEYGVIRVLEEMPQLMG